MPGNPSPWYGYSCVKSYETRQKNVKIHTKTRIRSYTGRYSGYYNSLKISLFASVVVRKLVSIIALRKSVINYCC